MLAKKIGIALGLVLTVCVLGIAAQVVHRRQMAQAFLAEATALQLRVSTLAQIQSLAARYGGQIDPSTCDASGCSYFFRFDNGWLHRLWLAPYMRLTCTLGSENGVLVYRRAILISGNGASHGAFVEEWLDYPKGIKGLPHVEEPFDIRRQTADVVGGRRWRVFVMLTADATPEQHRVAYNLNAGCLSRIGGCQDAQQLLPTIRWSQ